MRVGCDASLRSGTCGCVVCKVRDVCGGVVCGVGRSGMCGGENGMFGGWVLCVGEV